MKDGKPNEERDADGRRSAVQRKGSGGPKRQRSYIERATAALGHSGYGSESVRPHLRDQLRLKALLPSPYPTPEQQTLHGKDDHHR